MESEAEPRTVVYKPRSGERPLWDFPAGTLCEREIAAFVLSQALGWEIVPETVLREGPLGQGTVQPFIEHDPEETYFTMREAHQERFLQFAAFDVMANNADRKAGHCLRDPAGHVWGVDHGLTFHSEPKLRTVIWEFAGERPSPRMIEDLERLRLALGGDTGQRLEELLAPVEVAAVSDRLEALLDDPVLPIPVGDRPYPWPLV